MTWGVAPGALRAQPEIGARSLPEPQPGYVVSDPGQLTVEHAVASSGTAERVGRLYARARVAVEERLGLPLPHRPHAIVAPNDAEFARRYALQSGRGQPPAVNLLAVAFPAQGVLIIRQSGLREGTDSGLFRTLKHELAHLALGPLERRRGRRLPRWLNEGLSEWAAGRTPTSEEQTALESWARFGQIPDFATLAQRFPAHGQSMPRSYTISMAFLCWFAERAEVPELLRVLERADVEQAFHELVGQGVHDAELEWRADLAEDHNPLWTIVFGFDLWSVIALLSIVVIVRHMWVVRRMKRELIEAEEREDAAREAARRALEAEEALEGEEAAEDER